MSKLVKAFMGLTALMALSALLPSGAFAAKATITHPTGTTAPTGLNIIATNRDASNNHIVSVMTGPSGEELTRCTTAELTGTLVKNTHEAFEGNIEAAQFDGTVGVTPHTTHCNSTFGTSATVTPSRTSSVATNGLPWCLRSTAAMAADEFQVRGNSCANKERPIRFILHVFGSECIYERTTPIVGTFTTHPAQAVATITKQKFTRVSGSFICPAEGLLDITFRLYAETSGVESPLYIDAVA